MAESQIVFEHTMTSGQTIQVRHGDITREQSDCIVNAANGGLMHGGGVAGAIVACGGNSIQQESTEYVRQHGRLANGDVAVTRSGLLPTKAIIHAVGPIWQGNRDQIDDIDLIKSVWNSLTKATESNFSSISLPAISSGIFGFPKPRCARIMFAVAIRFVESERTIPREIRFTNYDQVTVRLFAAEFEHRFGDKADPYPDLSIEDTNALVGRICT